MKSEIKFEVSKTYGAPAQGRESGESEESGESRVPRAARTLGTM